MPDFIYLKSQDKIINLDHITQIDFMDGDTNEEDTLEIYYDDGDNTSIEGEEAEPVYLELVKKLPNLIVISGE